LKQQDIPSLKIVILVESVAFWNIGDVNDKDKSVVIFLVFI